jgi:integrase
MLGHSRVSTTLNTYSHTMPAEQDDAVTAAWATL